MRNVSHVGAPRRKIGNDLVISPIVAAIIHDDAGRLLLQEKSSGGRWESKLPAERVLHIDHLLARMQRLNTYEAKTNAMTRIGSSLSHVLPLLFRCE